MNESSKNNILLFLVDLLFAVSASVISILFIRYYFSAVPDFANAFFRYTVWSVAWSSLGLFISKTHKIMFKYASFKAILNIFACAIIKVTFLSIPYWLGRDYLMPHSGLMLICDGALTFLILILFKAVVAIYPSKAEIENALYSEEERTVTKLNVFIYGTDPKSISVVTRYENSKRYNVKGFITRDRGMAGKIIMGLPVHYIPKDPGKFHPKDIEAVLFSRYEDMQADPELVQICTEREICILAIPGTDNTNYPGLEVQEIKHILENNFIPDNMSGIERSFKRIIDLTGSTILIVLFSPLMLLIYFVIRINDGKPVLFKQERIGRFGRPFNILKFRTMRLDAESDGPALYSGDDDPRMTKVGRFLRLHHLDELPQLFNVFKGEMSFVGYRPERKVYIDKIVEKDPRYAYLYQIRPGVTSYATLKNGYTDTLDKMLRRLKFDLYYLNHRSLFFDIKVLWDTFLNIAVGKRF